MYKQYYGRKNQVHFKNENDYYEALGYLAKSDGTSSLVWEHNEEQGAWGSEGRIQFFIANVPIAAIFEYTAGVGNIRSRVNCNEYVQTIRRDHNFILGGNQSITDILKTVPSEFINDFERGLSL